MLMLPSMRQQFLEVASGLSWQAFEDVLQVSIGIVSVEFGGLYETHDVGGALASAQGPAEQPIRSSEGNWPDSVFDMVDGQVAVLQIAGQRFPSPQTVVDGFRRSGAIRDLATLSH